MQCDVVKPIKPRSLFKEARCSLSSTLGTLYSHGPLSAGNFFQFSPAERGFLSDLVEWKVQWT